MKAAARTAHAGADATVVRLRVLVPAGALPQWLGETLTALDALGWVALQLRRTLATPVQPPVGQVDRWWQRRLPPLRPWSPDAHARQRLAAWEAPATARPQIALGLDASAPDAAAGAPAPTRWALCDARGQPLWRPFPLIESITAGQGVRLLCLQQGAAGPAEWTLRRTLHVAAKPRYGDGLSGLATAAARLLEQALADVRLARGDAGGAGAASPVRPVAAPRASTPAVWLGLRGRWRGWCDRQRPRWISERWRVGVIDLPIARLLRPGPTPAVRWITSDRPDGYWADPFGLPGDARRLACEFFDERSGVGHLEVLLFDAAERIVRRTRLAVGGGRHTSFPNVFELDGQRLGLAETLSARQCVLHAVDEHGMWTPLHTLLDGVAAADPALFTWQGRYWLACTDTDLGEQDNLCLYHADRLAGPWQAHANNPVKVDVTAARMAGGLFRHDGALYRPAQDCLRTYGSAVVLHRVVELTPERFHEVAVRRIAPDAHGDCPDGLHTLTPWGERTLVDGKRHGVNLAAVRRKLGRAVALRMRRGNGAPARRRGPSSVARVFVYVPHLRMGGGEISMLRLAEGFAEAGLAVDLVVHSEQTRELELPPGVELLNLDCQGSVDAVRRLARALRQRRPRWLLSAFPHTNLASLAARAIARSDVRCVVSEHAPLSHQIAQQGGWRWRLLPPLLRWAYRRADAVVAVSNGVRDDLQALARLQVAPEVIRNPVLPHDLEAEIALAPDHPWLLDPALEIVLSVSRLSVEKDLPTLLRAFAEVHRLRPAARLLMAGDGPERERLQALVSELGLDAVARLPGRTDQPLRWMRHAAVFVLASRFEGFGNVLVEALACGTPVVSTDCPAGPREVLEGGRLGALVPVGDAAAMAREIRWALELRTVPPGAREAALRYTQASSCAHYLRLFESLYPGAGAAC